jgi:uncharacterized protein
MGFYILVLLTGILFWWRLKSDFTSGQQSIWRYVRFVIILITILLLCSFIKVIFLRGDIAEPGNAFSLIFFGAVAGLILTAGLFYTIFSLIRLGLATIFKRQLNWFRWVNTIATSVIILLFIYGYSYGRLHIKTEKRDIFLEGCDQRLDGLKIAFISDLHLSSFEHHYKKLSYVISEINTNRPDILINAGDFVTYGWQEFGKCDTILRKARAPLGSFAVTGNHDDCSYDRSIDLGKQSDGALIVDSLIKLSGYTLLNDTSKTIIYKGAQVSISGISTHGHRLNISYGDEKKALEGIRDSSLLIFIVHDPAYWDKNRNISKEADLTLAGHTHGMQIGLPTPWGLISPSSLIHKYWGGLYKANGHYLYVSRGMGTMGLAVRIFMPPEITIIKLHCKQTN